MCGSLLSKFRKKKTSFKAGITIFPEPGKNKSTRKPSNDDSACHENRGFWDNGDQTKVSETRSLASPHQRKNLLKDAISSQCEAGAVRALDRARRVLPAVNSTNVASSLPTGNSDHLLESAREILAIHGYRTSSTCSSTQPLSSINPTFSEQKTVMALNKAEDWEKKGEATAEKGEQKETERDARNVCEEGQRQSKLISLSNCNLACVAGEGKKKRDWKDWGSRFSSPPLPFIVLVRANCN